MISIIDTDSNRAFDKACYNAQMALQEKHNVTPKNFGEFDKNYHIHWENEYDIQLTGYDSGPITYHFKDDQQLMWFMLRWA